MKKILLLLLVMLGVFFAGCHLKRQSVVPKILEHENTDSVFLHVEGLKVFDYLFYADTCMKAMVFVVDSAFQLSSSDSLVNFSIENGSELDLEVSYGDSVTQITIYSAKYPEYKQVVGRFFDRNHIFAYVIRVDANVCVDKWLEEHNITIAGF